MTLYVLENTDPSVLILVRMSEANNQAHSQTTASTKSEWVVAEYLAGVRPTSDYFDIEFGENRWWPATPNPA